jgi:xylono-1,5-lactonase
MTAFRCVTGAKAALGEGTFGDPVTEVLWWVDIRGKAIHRYDPATGSAASIPTVV